MLQFGGILNDIYVCIGKILRPFVKMCAFSLKHLSLLGILVKNSPSTLATAGERYILTVLLTIGEGALMATLSLYHISVMLKLLIQCHTYGSLSLVGIFLLFKAGNE